MITKRKIIIIMITKRKIIIIMSISSNNRNDNENNDHFYNTRMLFVEVQTPLWTVAMTKP